MKNAILLLLVLIITVAGLWFAVRRIKAMRKGIKRRRLEKEAERNRRQEIREGAVSNSLRKHFFAYQAGVLYAIALFADSFAGVMLGLMCFVLSVLFYITTPWLGSIFSIILVLEPIALGLVFLGIEFLHMIDCAFFYREISGEYRARITTDKPHKDDAP